MSKKVPLVVDLSGPNGNVFNLINIANAIGKKHNVDTSALEGLMKRKYEDTLRILVEIFDFVDTSNMYPEIIDEADVQVVVTRK